MHWGAYPLVHQPAATRMKHCTRTWETQLTLLPWQPSQRITVLQHIIPPTTLAVSKICCSSLLCMAAMRCFGCFVITCYSDLTDSTRIKRQPLMNHPIISIIQAEINCKCHICIGNVIGFKKCTLADTVNVFAFPLCHSSSILSQYK